MNLKGTSGKSSPLILVGAVLLKLAARIPCGMARIKRLRGYFHPSYARSIMSSLLPIAVLLIAHGLFYIVFAFVTPPARVSRFFKIPSLFT
jgi:hypothetical protein